MTNINDAIITLAHKLNEVLESNGRVETLVTRQLGKETDDSYAGLCEAVRGVEAKVDSFGLYAAMINQLAVLTQNLSTRVRAVEEAIAAFDCGCGKTKVVERVTPPVSVDELMTRLMPSEDLGERIPMPRFPDTTEEVEKRITPTATEPELVVEPVSKRKSK